MRFFNLIILGIIVALFLVIRSWIDRKRERLYDIEIVRQGEEFLGSWASRSAGSFVYFRLRRDGGFESKRVANSDGDTVYTSGRYSIESAEYNRSTDHYPRLIVVNQNKDTLFNYFIAYVTPYDTKADKTDRMVLSPSGIYDTISYVFYRIKQ